jgi:hypothetical protein
MPHRLSHDRKKTSSDQQTQHLAQFLSLARRQLLPELLQVQRRRAARRRWGGTQGREWSDMEYLLVVQTGVPDTTAPVVTTPTR